MDPVADAGALKGTCCVAAAAVASAPMAGLRTSSATTRRSSPERRMIESGWIAISTTPGETLSPTLDSRAGSEPTRMSAVDRDGSLLKTPPCKYTGSACSALSAGATAARAAGRTESRAAVAWVSDAVGRGAESAAGWVPGLHPAASARAARAPKRKQGKRQVMVHSGPRSRHRRLKDGAARLWETLAERVAARSARSVHHAKPRASIFHVTKSPHAFGRAPQPSA